MKGVMLAIGAPKGDDKEEAAEGDESTAAAQDLIDAIKSGDAEAVALAFRAMMECC